ncbi:hypothetical protein D769_17979, partial [Cupriavidus sp. HMR-1]
APGAAVTPAGTGCAAQVGALINDSAAAQVNVFLVFMSGSVERYDCPGAYTHVSRHTPRHRTSFGRRARMASDRDGKRHGSVWAQGQ